MRIGTAGDDQPFTHLRMEVMSSTFLFIYYVSMRLIHEGGNEMERLKKTEIKAIRRVLGLTQTELAAMVGVSLPHISRTERDSSSEHAYNVSEKLDKKIKRLLEEMGMTVAQVLETAKRSGYLD
jgi:DNA-binding XRE family transcriptional regulator